MRPLLLALALFMIFVLAMTQDADVASKNSIIDTKTLHISGENLENKKLKPQQFSVHDPSDEHPVISDPAPISLKPNPISVHSPISENPIVKSVPMVVKVPAKVVPVKVAPKKSPVIDVPAKGNPVIELPARDALVIKIPKKAVPVIEVPVKSVPVIAIPKELPAIFGIPVRHNPVISPVKDIPPIEVPVKGIPVVNVPVKDAPVIDHPVVIKSPESVLNDPQPVKHAPMVNDPIVVDSPVPKPKDFFFYDNEINDHNAEPADPVSNEPKHVVYNPPQPPVDHFPWQGVTINGHNIGTMQVLAILSGLFVAVLLCMACVMYKLGQWSMTFNKGNGGIYTQVAIDNLSTTSSAEDLI